MNEADTLSQLAVYQAAMDHEQGAVSNYQGLILTLETALLGLFLALYQLDTREYLWVLPVMGILIGVSFGIACEYRLRNVDAWRKNIVSLVAGTDLEPVFRESKYRWSPVSKTRLQAIFQYLFGHWFERVILTMILATWGYILWSFPSPLVLRFASVPVALIWVTYVFQILRLRGGWMTEKVP